MEIVREHIWVTPSTPLVAFKEQGGVRVSAKFRDAEPARWTARVECKAITLLGPDSDETPTGDVKSLAQGSVDLFDSAGGKRLGTIQAHEWSSVWAQRETKGWLRVRGTSPFAFDAWIRETSVSKEGSLGLVGILAPQCSHETTAAIPLFIEPGSGTPVAELSPRAQFRVDSKASSAEFVAIQLAGLGTKHPSRRFFVKRTALEATATPLR